MTRRRTGGGQQLSFGDLFALAPPVAPVPAPVPSSPPSPNREAAFGSVTTTTVRPGRARPSATTTAPPADFSPATQADLAPAGQRAKAAANLAALRLLATLEEAPTGADQAVLARWSGWGSLPEIFDESKTAWSTERAELRALLDDAAWDAARRTVLNAHYTSVEVVDAMWAAVVALGFTGGRVLEPGCGSGAFIGLVPEGQACDFTGVELDPTTASIAAALYPGADIRSEGFETSRLAGGSFDLAIGNVPFAPLVLSDRTHNQARHSIHNHFILKSLALTRPGGLVALITSRYTLDARNPAARRQMAELADLVGAVRLPAGAMRAAAGTDAIMDILILRRREPGLAPDSAWDGLADLPTADGKTTPANVWFVEHPEMILGEVLLGSGQYRADEMTVRPTGPLALRLTAALTAITDRAAPRLRWAPATAVRAREATRGRVDVEHKEGALVAIAGGFARVRDGALEPWPVKEAEREELAAVLGLRDALAALLDAQATTLDDRAYASHAEALSRRYGAYSARWGALNRFTLRRTGRIRHACACGHRWSASRKDPPRRCPDCAAPYSGEGEVGWARLRPKMGGFSRDPDYFSVLALEVFDPDTQTAQRAAVFDRRIVAPRQAPAGAETARDALAICLDQTGEVDLGVIAGLLGVEEATARTELGDLVWRDPERGLVTAAAYLSGDVRAKLAVARDAAVRDPRYAANVEALAAVMPDDLGPGEIDARLGCTWIAPADVEAFARDPDMLGSEAVVVDHAPLTATWAVHTSSRERAGVAATSTWGTARANAYDILEHSLNQSAVKVWDVDSDGSRTLNTEATLEAREKQEALAARFAAWVWEDERRATRLAAVYNERFNSLVLPTWDGSHLSLPGLAVHFTPHAHQRDAIWRGISSPAVLLAHAVGAGKTFVMVATALELKRLGLASKPCLVVPNHMLEQVATEALQLYPQARVLVATREETTKADRKTFVARCATGDWDMIVMTRSAFGLIGVSKATAEKFMREELSALRTAAAESRNGKGLTTKKLELKAARLQEKLKDLLNLSRRDDGVSFEATGIDWLACDESQAFKNRAVVSSVEGANVAGSQRAEDLAMKLAFLRSRHGARIVTFATATPIANSVAEMYTVQRYLQPEALERAGVAAFDAWAATFGQTTTNLELSPDGSSYRLVSRFARYRNVPELLRMFRAVADVRTPEDLDIPGIPTVAGGAPETVVVPAGEVQRRYIASLATRAEWIRNGMPTVFSNDAGREIEDIMLRVCTHGRFVALDARLVNSDRADLGDNLGEPLTPDRPGKLAAAAERIAAIHHATRANAYLDAAGQRSRRRGAFQLVFCDIGTPKADGGWSPYAELRELLAERGVPCVRFAHDARDDRAKAELYAACRDGRVPVLIGSTEKLGTGTNFQDRLVAIHHLDCPWRPIDIEQRDGRGIRQGNQNPEVAVIRYVTEATFDVFMWQTCERKAAFIHQVMRGRMVGRQIDDIGEQALSFAEVKALATGNPLIMEKAGVDGDVARLLRAQRAHHADQSRLARILSTAGERRERLTRLVATLEEAVPLVTDTHADLFTLTVDGRTYDDRKEAGGQLKALLVSLIRNAGERTITGSFAGLTLSMGRIRDRFHDGSATTLGYIDLEPGGIRLTFASHEVGGADAVGLCNRLAQRTRDLDVDLEVCRRDLARIGAEVDQATGRLGLPFDQQDILDGLLVRQARIDAQLEDLLKPKDEAAA